MCNSTLLIIGIIIGLTPTHNAVTIERNLYSYYKLPNKFIDVNQQHLNKSIDYVILQCPYRPTTAIPKPKDMQICAIVGQFTKNLSTTILQPWQQKSKPLTTLNTKVEYKLEKKRAREKKPTFNCPCQYDYYGFRKPTSFPVPLRYWPAPLQYRKHVPQTFEYRPYYQDQRTLMSATRANILPAANKYNNSSKSHNNNKELKVHRQPATTANSAKIPASNETNSSPLRFLSVKNAVKQLFNQKTPPFAAQNTADSAEKFFAENIQFKKGEQMKGYQNVYHRDEVFNDHIFYDDVDEVGQFQSRYKNSTNE